MPPRMIKIDKICTETPFHKTFYFQDVSSREGKPGQFVMIWVPGIDEIPMSLSHTGTHQAVTIEKVGTATSHLFQMNPGDLIGIRGPYGQGFHDKGQNPLFIAGGTGIAPLYPLIKKMDKGHVVLGAQTSQHLLFVEKIQKTGIHLHIATNDGSQGFQGTAVELAHNLLPKTKTDGIFTCGPEKMMAQIFHLASNFSVPIQASLERYMKCGLGLCDSCAIDGLHVCKDGPVFDETILANLNDFGKHYRKSSGKKAPLK
jgi:dihydroorotate dehydrogenase electron transfer subunit